MKDIDNLRTSPWIQLCNAFLLTLVLAMPDGAPERMASSPSCTMADGSCQIHPAVQVLAPFKLSLWSEAAGIASAPWNASGRNGYAVLLRGQCPKQPDLTESCSRLFRGTGVSFAGRTLFLW